MGKITAGIKITVNANVCSAIEMNFPDSLKLTELIDPTTNKATIISDAGYC